jgi:hypothetical protein
MWSRVVIDIGIDSQMDAAWMVSYIAKSVYQLGSAGSTLPTLPAVQAMIVLLVSGCMLLAKLLRPAWCGPQFTTKIHSRLRIL